MGKTGEGLATIVVVDDDPLVRRSLTRSLRRGGYSVLAFADGQEAYDYLLLQRDGVDAVVSDVEMPRMTGLTLRQSLRALHPELPVLLISGTAHFTSGADRLRKPFAMTELLAWLEAQTGTQAGRQPAETRQRSAG